MIEGERVVTAMAFTILRIHSKKLLKMRDMDEMTEFLQCQLNKNFGYTDDYVIKVLEQSMSDLRRYKMDLPPPPHESELPKYECGRFIEPDYESKVSLIEDFLAYGYPIFDFIKVRIYYNQLPFFCCNTKCSSPTIRNMSSFCVNVHILHRFYIHHLFINCLCSTTSEQ